MRITTEYFNKDVPLKNVSGGRWVPCRPVDVLGLVDRFRQAWDVLTGKADALYWELQ